MRDQLVAIGEGILGSLTTLAPKLLLAVVLVLLGLALGAAAQRITRTVLRRAKIDALIERLGLAQRLDQQSIESKLVNGFSRVVFFLVAAVFAQSAIDILGLTAVSDAVRAVLGYLPRVLGAAVILTLGVLIARVVGGLAGRMAGESGVGYAALLRQAVTAIIIFTSAVMAVSELEVDTEMIESVTRIALAGVALAVAITFGFGTREATRNLVAGFYLRKLIRPGEEIEVEGVVGTLVAVTQVQTVIDRGAGETRIIANSVLLRSVTKK